jgi:hypothetical protein
VATDLSLGSSVCRKQCTQQTLQIRMRTFSRECCRLCSRPELGNGTAYWQPVVNVPVMQTFSSPREVRVESQRKLVTYINQFVLQNNVPTYSTAQISKAFLLSKRTWLLKEYLQLRQHGKSAILWLIRTICNIDRETAKDSEQQNKVKCISTNFIFVGCILLRYLRILYEHIINSMVWIREPTIPTERPPLVGEVIANFCG